MEKYLFSYSDGTTSIHEVSDKLELFQLLKELDPFEDMYVSTNDKWKKIERS